jgi:hypothetical protein
VTNPTFSDLQKNDTLIHWPSYNLFKIYFDELPTGKQADRMLVFLRDAKFIDSFTDTIDVEMVVYNAQQELFCICSFSFVWQTAGTIKWDYRYINYMYAYICIYVYTCTHARARALTYIHQACHAHKIQFHVASCNLSFST